MKDNGVITRAIDTLTEDVLGSAQIVRANKLGSAVDGCAQNVQNSAILLYAFHKNGGVTNPSAKLICSTIDWLSKQNGGTVGDFLSRPHAGEAIACALKGTAALPAPKPVGRVIANDKFTA